MHFSIGEMLFLLLTGMGLYESIKKLKEPQKILAEFKKNKKEIEDLMGKDFLYLFMLVMHASLFVWAMFLSRSNFTLGFLTVSSLVSLFTINLMINGKINDENIKYYGPVDCVSTFAWVLIAHEVITKAPIY